MANKKGLLKCILGILLMMLIFGFWQRAQRQKTRKEIEQNIGYAVGIFESKIQNKSLYGPTTTDILISFRANGKRWNTNIKGKSVDNEKAQKKALYLVVYDTLNPENCQILFDYPIKDSSDFLEYLEQFKNKPLYFDKYF